MVTPWKKSNSLFYFTRHTYYTGTAINSTKNQQVQSIDHLRLTFHCINFEHGINIAYFSLVSEMVALKSCEILDELRKLGITSTSEAIQYINDYSSYYIPADLKQAYTEEA